MATNANDWRDASLFDNLDESWIEDGGGLDGIASSTTQQQQQADTHQHVLSSLERKIEDNDGIGSSVSSQAGSSSSTTTTATVSTATTAKADSIPETNLLLPIIQVKKRNNTKKEEENVQKPSREVSESELLQPGPSSPSLRSASHKRSVSDEVRLERDEVEDQLGRRDVKDGDPSSPLPSSEKMFRTTPSSEEKRESHANRDNTESEEAVDNEIVEEESQFNSAREEQSMSQAVTAVEEVTFIEHSNVGNNDGNPEKRWNIQELRKDMFKKPELQLKTMFQVPSPIRHQGSSVEAGLAETGEEAEPSKLDGEESREDVDEEEQNKSGREEIEAGEMVEGRDNVNEQPTNIEEEKETPVDQVSIDEHPALVPQCTFTFASPVLKSANKLTPSTPSASHGLMRLLPRGAQDSEIEQILNTPRSERKSGDVQKLVSRLVEQDRSERERKRLRVDERLKTEEILVAEEEEEEVWSPNLAQDEFLEDEVSQVQADTHRKDYVRDAPAFMERLRSVRFPSDATSRSSVSSLISSRRGAKAPTPESSLLKGRHLRPLGKGQSPRKILRLWSAANQVDEELAEEEREAEAEEAAEQEWQDIPEASSPPEVAYLADVPIVSVDPPTQRGLDDVVNGAKETWQPGMLHIGPEDIDPEEIENMANGRMTFDRAMNKWVPAKSERKKVGNRGDSSEESSDPFRDIESFASQSSVGKLNQLHVPKSQSALRNEVQMNDSTSTSTQLSDSTKDISEVIQRQNYLSAPKTPNPSSESFRSPTPRSILKTGRSLLTPEGRSPIAIGQQPRSISFADGDTQQQQSSQKQRVEKVEQLLLELAQLALGPDDSIEEIEPRQETPTRKLNFTPSASLGVRSPWNISTMRRQQGDSIGNASFLTNASFNVAHDRILELITDVAPWEPGWHGLKQIDLSKRRVESVVRLKDFLPCLEEAILDDNEISYLTGLPSSLRILSVSSNRLPPTVSFGHLINLESLDISINHIDDSLMSLKQLVHLRHLRAEGNGITSLEGILHLPKLESINLRENHLQVINVETNQWPRLKDLILSHNQIVTIHGLSHLKHLRCLNLDHNNLSRLDLGSRMSRLKQLRLSGNVLLDRLDVGPALNLRMLYADDCSLQEVLNIHQLQKLDNLSLRQQNGDNCGIDWPANKIRDIKRLFLSGNAFRTIDLTDRASLSASSTTKFYSMVYLELSACQLTSLPLDLSELVPNLRHLNADYNLFEKLPVLSNLRRLKRFSVIGCRISKSRRVVESLNGCDELAVLDVRMNPCTMGLYPPILLTAVTHGNQVNKAFLPPIPNPTIARPDLQVNEEAEQRITSSSEEPGNKSFFHKRMPAPDLSTLSSAKQDDEKGGQKLNALFVASDNRFFRTLPAQYRLQRLLHRGALAMACPQLTWLDGLLIDEEEVHQADDYFKARFRATTNSATTSANKQNGNSESESTTSTF